MEQNKEALLELTKHFIELINVDIDEKGRIRKKTIAELVEMYIDYHSANCNLIEPKTVIDCLVSSVICIGMVVAINRPMRNLGHPMRASALAVLTEYLCDTLEAIVTHCKEAETEATHEDK